MARRRELTSMAPRAAPRRGPPRISRPRPIARARGFHKRKAAGWGPGGSRTSAIVFGGWECTAGARLGYIGDYRPLSARMSISMPLSKPSPPQRWLHQSLPFAEPAAPIPA